MQQLGTPQDKLNYLTGSESGPLRDLLSPPEMKVLTEALNYYRYLTLHRTSQRDVENILQQLVSRVTQREFNSKYVTKGRSLTQKLQGLNRISQCLIYGVLNNHFINSTVDVTIWNQFLPLVWDKKQKGVDASLVEVLRAKYVDSTHFKKISPFLRDRYFADAVRELNWIGNSMGRREWGHVPKVKPQDRLTMLRLLRSAPPGRPALLSRYPSGQESNEKLEALTDRRWTAVTKLRALWLDGIIPTKNWLEDHDGALLKELEDLYYGDFELAYYSAGYPKYVDEIGKSRIDPRDYHHMPDDAPGTEEDLKEVLRTSGSSLSAMLHLPTTRILVPLVLGYGEGDWIQGVEILTGAKPLMPDLKSVSREWVALVFSKIRFGGKTTRKYAIRRAMREAA